MILIIGYGNELRGDDGAGLALAERLEQGCVRRGWPVRRLSVHQLTPELAAEVADPAVRAVLFVDARVATNADDRRVTIAEAAIPATVQGRLGHYTDPTAVLAYAGLFTPGPLPRAWVVTVPAVAFDHGQGLSAVAQASIEEGVQEVLSLLAVQEAPL